MRNVFLENLPLKMLSLLLALVVWFYVNFVISPVVERTLTIPLRVINQAPATWLGSLPGQCTITVQAPRRDVVSSLYGDGVFAHINLMSVQPNMNNRVPVVLNLPANLPVTHQSPKYVEVTPRMLKSRELPVELKTLGAPRDGYYLRKTTVAPARVVITAPEDLLTEQLGCTLEVDVNGREDDFTVTLPVFADMRRNYPGFTVDVAEVSVRVLINPWPSREVPVRPVLTGEVALGFEINAVSAEPAKVYIKGLPELLAPVKDVPTLSLTVAGLETGIRQQVDLDMSTLPGLFLETQRVMVTVAVEQIIRSRRFVGIRPEVLAPDTWDVQLQPVRLDLLLTGPQRLVDALPAAGPRVQVDCRGTDSREVELPLILDAGTGSVGLELRPDRVRVLIRRPWSGDKP